MHPGFGKLTLNMVWEKIYKILFGCGEIGWVEVVARLFPGQTVQSISLGHSVWQDDFGIFDIVTSYIVHRKSYLQQVFRSLIGVIR